MPTDHASDPSFEPRQIVSRRKRPLYAVLFGLVWAVAFVATAYVAFDTDAIQLGLLVASASFLVAAALLWFSVFMRRHHEGKHPVLPVRRRRAQPGT